MFLQVENLDSDQTVLNLPCRHIATCSYAGYQLICSFFQGFFKQFWEKAPGQNWEKMIDLTAKLGEINDRTYQG